MFAGLEVDFPALKAGNCPRCSSEIGLDVSDDPSYHFENKLSSVM